MQAMPSGSNLEQLSLPLTQPEITLPILDAPVQRTRIWDIQHRILPVAVTRPIASRVRWESGKSRGDTVVTDRGEKILLFEEGARVPRLQFGYTGILAPSGGESVPEWRSHLALNEYKANLRAGEDVRRNHAVLSWRNVLAYIETDGAGAPGFRKPQLGALHAIGAHWTISREAATITMPTGTGKTETMLAALVGYSCRCVLVVTPSAAVRDQVAEKFKTLGKLREFGLVADSAMNPVVGVIKRRPRSSADLAVFKRCNIVVSTVSAIAQGTAEKFAPEIAELCSHLFIDEAHHVPAKTWSFLRAAFSKRLVLQFTATPFREDGEQLEGKPIYSYPLATAQKEEYFKRIHFKGIFEESEDKEDEAVAQVAVEQLRTDLNAGYDHLLMARCSNKKRAKQLSDLYKKIAPEFNPIEVHSDIQRAREKTEQLFKRQSRIVVCVNMLSEGFDLPNLKIAAVHDKHKSLAVLLQFVGRFTRTAAESAKIHDATVVANLADAEVSEALRNLYVEDADWDQLLAEVSHARLERERRILEFVRSARPLIPEEKMNRRSKVALLSIRPKQSAILYESAQFLPEKFVDALAATDELEGAWMFDEARMIVSVHLAKEKVKWTRNRRVEDQLWELRVAYFHRLSGLLFIHGSAQDELYEELAAALSGGSAQRLEGNDCFRVFGGINRLTLHQAGLKKQSARRAVSYTQVSGSDVKPGLDAAELQHSRKAMIAGTGFSNGVKVIVGGSRKGKIWARHSAALTEFRDWCDRVAAKVRDTSIDPDEVIEDGLKAEIVRSMPGAQALRIEWGERLQSGGASSPVSFGGTEVAFYECDIELGQRRTDGNFEFSVVTASGDEVRWAYAVNEQGFYITLLSGQDPKISFGRRSKSLTEYFQEDPPSILFVDGSELMGAEIYAPKQFGGEFDAGQLIPKDWAGVDITMESIYKGGVERTNSVQARAVQLCLAEGFDFIFNDDDAGEVADLVALRKTADSFVVRFVHCKYSKRLAPGLRISDVTEVASQAARSVKNTGQFHELVKKLRKRSKRLHGKPTRFVAGGPSLLTRYERLATAVAPEFEIIAVQPGLLKTKVTVDQQTVLGAADAYLRQTVEIPLTVWCSA